MLCPIQSIVNFCEDRPVKKFRKWLPALLGVALFSAIVVVVAGISQAPVSVTVPTLTQGAQRGQVVFEANCAVCHGENGSGSRQGPPLVHKTYNPGHHGDRAFYRAVQQGVAAHHWAFGDMPPLRHVTESQIRSVVRYVRELQRANGIEYQRHRM